MKINFKFYHLLLLAGALTLGSCRKDYVQVQPPPVITTPVTFTADIYPLLTAYNCADCHSSGGQAPDLSADAAAFTDLTTNGYINTANPSSSTFYISVTSAYSGASGQMYPGGPYMTAEEQAKILAWITQGANH